MAPLRRRFRLMRGAIAATTNCENQNLVVVGVSDAEIAFASRAIEKLGGGYVTVSDGEVLAEVPLEVDGCMSDRPWEEVRDRSLPCHEAAFGSDHAGHRDLYLLLLGLSSQDLAVMRGAFRK